MDKYDRQIRLWGHHAQQRLSHSHVLITSGDALASEVLKNLVLAGIGEYTIVDQALVEQSDIMTNYLTPPQSLGLPRAQQIIHRLSQMNPDVKSNWLPSMPSFHKYDLVICLQMDHQQQLHQAQNGLQENTPVMFLYSLGLLGYLRISCHSLQVHSATRHTPVHDLRLFKGFSQLDAYVQSFDLPSLDQHSLLHVPYVVIIRKALQEYQNRNGRAPQNYQQKKDFRDLIIELSRGTFKNNVSFQEAHSHAWKAFPQEIPQNLKDLFNELESAPHNINDPFWQVVTALKIFYEQENALPLLGDIPDMHSTTQYYVQLRAAYHSKCQEDKTIFKNILEQVVHDHGLEYSYSSNELVHWIKHAVDLQNIRYRPISEELNHLKIEPNQENNNYKWAMVLKGAMKFHSEYKRKPGLSDQQVLDQAIQECILLNEQPIIIEPKYSHEACRYEGHTFHTTIAMLSGLASQEIIKIVTQQNQPIVHTLVYDGVESTICTYDW